MKNAAQYKTLGAYGTIGLEIVLSILLGLWFGTWLDKWLGTAPWMAVVWFGFGCAAAGRAVYRSWKDMQAAAKREEAEEGNPAQQFPDEAMQRWKHEEERAAKSRGRAKKREGAGTEGEAARDGVEGSRGEARCGEARWLTRRTTAGQDKTLKAAVRYVAATGGVFAIGAGIVEGLRFGLGWPPAR